MKLATTFAPSPGHSFLICEMSGDELAATKVSASCDCVSVSASNPRDSRADYLRGAKALTKREVGTKWDGVIVLDAGLCSPEPPSRLKD